MISLKKMSFNPTSPILKDDSSKEKQMQDFVKQMLVSRLFIGTFQEKRYVECLKSYRDVIVISKEETELARDVEVVKNRLQSYHGDADHWIGITSPDTIGAPAGYCFWVELPQEVFGSYWYKISRIKFTTNETKLRLKIIRPVNTDGVAASLSFKKADGLTNTSVVDTFQFSKLQNDLCTSIAATGQQLKTVVNVHNTTEAVKFIFLLLIALCGGLLKCIEFLGNFSIKLMNEASNFIRSVTPIIIAFINLIGKIIGGFYLLILSMWRDRNGPAPVYTSPYINHLPGSARNQYNTVYYRRALPPAQRKSGPVITPLD